MQVSEGLLTHRTVVTDALDVKETSIGCKADLFEIFEILRLRPMAKSYQSLITISALKARPSLKYCLMRDLLLSTCSDGVTPSGRVGNWRGGASTRGLCFPRQERRWEYNLRQLPTVPAWPAAHTNPLKVP